MFTYFGIPVVCNHYYLGGVFGELAGNNAFVQKITNTSIDFKCAWSLSMIEDKQSQAAFQSLQCEWQFLMCVILDCISLFPLRWCFDLCFLASHFWFFTLSGSCFYCLCDWLGLVFIDHNYYAANFCFAALKDTTKVIVEAVHDLHRLLGFITMKHLCCVNIRIF